MSLRRQPSEERLLAFAAGTLSPPEAVVVATHLALRPETRAWTDLGRAVGGDVLENLDPVALDADARDATLARLNAPSASETPTPPAGADPSLPAPLRHFPLGRWRWLGPGVHVRDVIGPRDGDCRVILLRIAPGQCTPRHTHGGLELTCVISGAYATEDGVFSAGDFEEADPNVTHQPRVVSAEPCLCVAALDGQIVLPGKLGRLLAPFVRL
ncbi:cadmium/peroxide/UV radiation responsive anti-sigma factor ChrR [Caulobacter sp. RL271]|jgi:putative transcriptional regulator|uniref:ChrR family anti-sigma-E factor n=1 Tax=Caulobacter segnis TaxID=88688 RepID=A0ABY4ZZ05_9CAUL|nr:ChrR family anti-sigma-E factor [Caulobacter segnis]USQ98010.1 ChrR family anti-sigma-E factor [Caulobacter segnis]